MALNILNCSQLDPNAFAVTTGGLLTLKGQPTSIIANSLTLNGAGQLVSDVNGVLSTPLTIAHSITGTQTGTATEIIKAGDTITYSVDTTGTGSDVLVSATDRVIIPQFKFVQFASSGNNSNAFIANDPTVVDVVDSNYWIPQASNVFYRGTSITFTLTRDTNVQFNYSGEVNARNLTTAEGRNITLGTQFEIDGVVEPQYTRNTNIEVHLGQFGASNDWHRSRTFFKKLSAGTHTFSYRLGFTGGFTAGTAIQDSQPQLSVMWY